VRRLERRLDRVLRQLELRIAEIDRLHANYERQLLVTARGRQLQRRLVELEREAAAWRGHYEGLMAAKTMKALRLPRAVYGALRAGLDRWKSGAPIAAHRTK
jgi:hypothetical protein